MFCEKACNLTALVDSWEQLMRGTRKTGAVLMVWTAPTDPAGPFWRRHRERPDVRFGRRGPLLGGSRNRYTHAEQNRTVARALAASRSPPKGTANCLMGLYLPKFGQ